MEKIVDAFVSMRGGVEVRERTKGAVKVNRISKVVVIASIGTNAMAVKNHPTDIAADANIVDNAAVAETISAAEVRVVAEAVVLSEDIIDGGVT
ncbi:protein tssc1 [Lasius niger]|uniref:Protein tssc1 n=1 Tax=Lasius niger TaxID=67767 RepID=A0A0J7KQ04_LASNI|nr:protein tssc1 [Lasius niger]